jgi:hypothetical protein
LRDPIAAVPQPFQVLLEIRQHVRDELLERRVVAVFGIVVEELDGLSMRLHLLLRIDPVKLLGLRLVQRIDARPVDAVEAARQVRSELLGLHDVLQLLGRRAMRLDHKQTELLDRVRLPLLARDFSRLDLIEIVDGGPAQEVRRARRRAARNESQRAESGDSALQ